MAVDTRRQPRIPLEELCRLPTFFLPSISWSGDQLAFYWDKTGRMELHVMDLATKQIRQVSHGEVPSALRAGFAWDRADKTVVFAKDSGGDEQHDLYAIDVATSAVTQMTKDPTAQEYVVQQSGTGVTAAHRGHKLGLWMKAVMLQRILRERPAAKFIRTGNANVNKNMLEINTQLGFRHAWSNTLWQLPLAEARTSLGLREQAKV